MRLAYVGVTLRNYAKFVVYAKPSMRLVQASLT